MKKNQCYNIFQNHNWDKKFNPIYSNKNKKINPIKGKSINEPQKGKNWQEIPSMALHYNKMWLWTCDEWAGVEITNYFSGLTNDLGQCYMLRFKIDHSPRPKEKNNTLGYPIMKKEKKKERRERRKKSPKN